jgi:F-type H+-transporting ATPase subunit delta
MAESEVTRRFLVGPHVSRERKKALLAESYPEAEDGRFLNFLRTLVDKNRANLLPRIAVAYRRLELASRGVATGIVETAYPLEKETLERLSIAFARRLGVREFRASVRVIPEMIGGLRVIIGSSVYDGSMRSSLRRLRGEMTK